MRLRRLAVGHRLVGIFVFQLVEGEGAGVGDLDGAGERIFVAGEQPRHLLRRFEMPLGIGFELQPSVMDRAFLADAGEHVLQGPAMGCVIEHGVGGDEGKAHACCQLRQRLDAGAVVAAIRMLRGEIEPRLGASVCLMRSGVRLVESPWRFPPHQGAGEKAMIFRGLLIRADWFPVIGQESQGRAMKMRPSAWAATSAR